MRFPTKQDWVFSLVTFAAATLALYIAFAADLDRPYWAAGTVYIVSQRTAGALNAKARWRLIGTLCGAAFAVAVIPNLVDSPPLLIAAYAAWIAVCLGGSLLDGSLRGYAFMLAGYTAAIIGFPAVDTPEAIFDTAVARVEEIGLGIVCSHVVHAAVLGRNIGASLRSRMLAWLTDLASITAATLDSSGEHRDINRTEWRRLALDVGGIDQLFDQARYEDERPQVIENMRILRRHVRRAGLLMASATARMHDLQRNEPDLLREIAPLIDDTGRWLAESINGTGALQRTHPEPLLRRLNAAEARLPTQHDWAGLMQLGMLRRLRDLVTLWDECLDLLEGRQGQTPPAQARPWLRGHVDPLLVTLSCAAVAASLILVCTIWRFTDWTAGATAAMMAAVAGSIFAHLDDPAPAIGSFLLGNVLAVLTACLFLFGVLPALDGFPALIAALALFFVPATAFVSNPAMTTWMTPFVISTFPSMSLQETYNANFVTFANNGLATVLGIGLTLLVTRVMRSMDVRQRVSRLVRADRRDLAEIAGGHEDRDTGEILDRMLDRFEAVAIRLGDELSEEPASLEFGDLRASLNIKDLRASLEHLSSAARPIVKDAIGAVGAYARGTTTDTQMLRSLDGALSASRAWREPADRDAALELAGVRLALFPAAPPPVPEQTRDS
jgi:uncharacterized membrane protein YccC